jgi:hypothetical protein
MLYDIDSPLRAYFGGDNLPVGTLFHDAYFGLGIHLYDA